MHDKPLLFSQALHTGQKSEIIVQNRKEFLDTFGVSKDVNIVLANQTHSNHIAIIDTYENRGWEELESAIPDTDALITDKKELLLGILSADCLPILLFDPKKEVVAAIHAGWAGTHKKIAQKTLLKMTEHFSSNPKDIIAQFAPCIAPCCYEVGTEFKERFKEYRGALEKRANKLYLDIPLINNLQLQEVGVLKENIHQSDICTACENERFFSYRKEGGCSGRMLTLIGMKS
ncbi:MAG: peptidoglycan editing factor PgeF [Campylobacterales bacterium]|nr:peptidoglycan editing factor PgeF [Campylobacterales bacterium]